MWRECDKRTSFALLRVMLPVGDQKLCKHMLEWSMMKNAIWATDIHLDHLENAEIFEFMDSVNSADPDGLLLCGDIATASSIEPMLELMDEHVMCPVYFVLGNHDFYGGSIENIRKLVSKRCKTLKNTCYLTGKNVVTFTKETALIGHDGWYDGRAGNYMASPIALKDYYLIEDFMPLHKAARAQKMLSLADDGNQVLVKRLQSAFHKANLVILVTHVPPFREASRFNNQVSNDDWAPHFVNQGLGEKLVATMKEWPSKRLLVLCGHSHHEADILPLENLRVLCGKATYGRPQIQVPLPWFDSLCK